MSRFVSAGTDDEPSERDEAWVKAHVELEAKRREKAEAGKQDGGKTLYETLQANKAAKQEAFEESIRLKNQFRSLDEDEVEFLDSVLESTRAKEAEVKKETIQQLDAFRKQQEEAEQAANQQDDVEIPETEAWKAAPRKRKKGRENAIGGNRVDTDAAEGLKLRKTSTAEKDSKILSQALEGSEKGALSSPVEKSGKVEDPATSQSERSIAKNTLHTAEPTPKSPSATTSGLGLAAYSSDEDE